MLKKAVVILLASLMIMQSTASIAEEDEKISKDTSTKILGALIVWGVASTLWNQSIERFEKEKQLTAIEAERKATETSTVRIKLKPKNSYVFHNKQSNKAPEIVYIESCNPLKGFKASGYLENNKLTIGYMTNSIDSCDRSYDSRKEKVVEHAGNPWNMNDGSYNKQEAKSAEKYKGSIMLSGDSPIGLGAAALGLFGIVANATDKLLPPEQKATPYSRCSAKCKALHENTLAHCTGLEDNGKILSRNPRRDCKNHADSALSSCNHSCK